MQFLPLRVSCLGPVLRVFSVEGGAGPVSASPCLPLDRVSPRGWARVSGAVWCPGGRWGGGRQGRGGGLLGAGVGQPPVRSPLGMWLCSGLTEG